MPAYYPFGILTPPTSEVVYIHASSGTTEKSTWRAGHFFGCINNKKFDIVIKYAFSLDVYWAIIVFQPFDVENCVEVLKFHRKELHSIQQF